LREDQLPQLRYRRGSEKAIYAVAVSIPTARLSNVATVGATLFIGGSREAQCRRLQGALAEAFSIAIAVGADIGGLLARVISQHHIDHGWSQRAHGALLSELASATTMRRGALWRH
jgi:hypothetical protein